MTTADTILRSFKEGYLTRGYVRQCTDISCLFNRTCVIPVNEGTFEIPLFALKHAKNHNDKWSQADTVAVHIQQLSLAAPYSTVEANVKYCQTIPVLRGIYKMNIPRSDNFYYCTVGAVFDRFWRPLCIASWEARIEREKPPFPYIQYLQPLFRIEPRVMVQKEDALQKFIAGKWMKILLENFVECPDSYQQKQVSIRIEPIPLQLTVVRQPDITVTAEKLTDILKQNINEICA